MRFPTRKIHHQMFEFLEHRTLLSAGMGMHGVPKSTPNFGERASIGAVIYHRPAHNSRGARAGSGTASPAASSSAVGLNPSTIRHAYGVDQVLFGSFAGSGAGQTIALIDAYDSPTAYADLQHFDTTFGLADPPSFRRVAEDGSTNYPLTDPAGAGNANGTWEVETALDVEWAHVMAPQANLLLVEAASPNFSDLVQAAANYARSQPGVSAVSMSFGGDEFSSETQLDTYFTTPANHAGITFLASTGDSGAPGGYPAASPNVVAVGGTTLHLTAGNYASESGWSGSGGSVSPYETLPSYQKGVVTQSTVHRATPDVALDADPSSGVAVYDSYDFPGTASWIQVGGTSLATPLWAGVVAMTDQARALRGLAALDGRTQTLPAIYGLSSSDLHDITTGNNGHPAASGYDLVTGRGSPVINTAVFDLGGVQSSSFSTGLIVGGTSGNDMIYLRRSGSTLDEWINASQPGQGTPTLQTSLTGVTTLSIHGNGGNDVVTLDESGGDILVQASSLDNTGGTLALSVIGTSGADTLNVAASGASVTFNAGTLIIANVTSIAYTDTSGGDTITTAGPAPVTLTITMDDNITVNGGNATINYVG